MNILRLAKTAPGYAVVAVVCVVLNNSLLVGLDYAGLHYVFSALTAAAIIIPISYVLHCQFTYSTNEQRTNFLIYAIFQSANVPATLVLLFLLHDLAGIPMAGSAILLTIIMAAYNFLGSFLVIAVNRPVSSPRDKE